MRLVLTVSKFLLSLFSVCAVIFVALVVACVQPDGALYSPTGDLLLGTQEEIAEAQAALLLIQGPEDLPKEMTGGVLFDGEVRQIDKAGNGAIIVHLEDVRYVTPGFEGNSFKVKSPSVERGGIAFEEGARYRVFVVFLEGEYLTWASVGTVKIP
jgi:hypothetical protein